MGDSLGAAVSLQLALKHPHLFRHVISLSGAFFKPLQNHLQASGDLSWLDVWMLIGNQEEHVETSRGVFDFLTLNRETRELLEERNAHVFYTEKHGSHIWGFWQEHLPEALKYFFGRSRA